MLREYQPCIPTRGTDVPTGPEWFHEIKHDGFRLIVQREGKRVRLFARRGYNWSGRYPLIVQAALKLRARSFVLDGEAVILDADGLADFEKLHTRKHDAEVTLIAFDLLMVGEDVRSLPLHERKRLLKKLLAKSGEAIQLNPHMEGDIGASMFEHACNMGLEGIVSKHRESGYRAGPCKHWIKVKNPRPAMRRAKEVDQAQRGNSISRDPPSCFTSERKSTEPQVFG